MKKPQKKESETYKGYFRRLRIYNSEYEKSIREGKNILARWRE